MDRSEGQLEVADDPVDHGIVGEEGDALQSAAAARADHGVYAAVRTRYRNRNDSG